MLESFSNAPLIELIAEVRWAQAEPISPSEDDVNMFIGPSAFLQQANVGFAALGYSQVERLAPMGMDLEDEPLLRYMNPKDPDSSVIYRLGESGFSVSAIPPYRTWEDFQPRLIEGLEIIIGALEATGGPAEFTRVNLNYVDAFGPEFWKSTGRFEFLTQGLGFTVTQPQAISQRLKSGEMSSAWLDYRGTTLDGDRVQIKAGLGTVLNVQSVIMDTAVSHREPVPRTVSDVSRVLNVAHTFIHDTFSEITAKYIDVLRQG